MGVGWVDGLALGVTGGEDRTGRDLPAVHFRIQHAVERALELPSDLGENAAAHGMESVVAGPDAQPALAHRACLTRLGAVLVQVHRPDRRERTQLFCARRGCGIRSLTPCRCRDLLVGGQPARDPRGAGQDRPADGHHPVHPDVARGERGAHHRQRRREQLARGHRDRLEHRPRSLHHVAGAQSRGARRALHHLADRPAAESRRHPIPRRPTVGAIAYLPGGLDQQRLGGSHDPRRGSHHLEHLGVGESPRGVIGEQVARRLGEVVADPFESGREVVHTCILTVTSDIPAPIKCQIRI